MQPTAGSSTAEPQPFLFDFASPLDYLAAETLPVEREWVPARRGPGAYDLEQLERELAARGLQPLRLPDPFPFDSELALRAATYASQIGRCVAFSLAAFRQAYAAGRNLADPDNVLIAAAACEMHPRAVLQALERPAIERALSEASA